MSAKRYFDIGVIIPLEEELNEFSKVFDMFENLSKPTSFRFRFNTGSKNVEGIVVQQQDMGKTLALRATRDLLADYDVGLLVCLGIAGGISTDTHIGDVCYSEKVIDVYDNAKVTEKPKGKIDPQFSPHYYATDPRLVHAFNFSRTIPELKKKYEAWQNRRLKESRKLLLGEFTGRDGKETLELPQTRNGKFACAAISKSPEYNKKLLAIERKILVIETESGGVFEAAAKSYSISIRGVSDYADLDKRAGPVYLNRFPGFISEVSAMG